MNQELDRAFPSLSESNIRLYAARAYDSPSNITSEFEEDWQRFRFIKRAMRKYRKTGVITERIIINHLCVLYNVFGNAATRMLFLKIDREDWSTLKTYLAYMSRMPATVRGINDKDILAGEIAWDPKIVRTLGRL